jgi:hypothetical protein
MKRIWHEEQADILKLVVKFVEVLGKFDNRRELVWLVWELELPLVAEEVPPFHCRC